MVIEVRWGSATHRGRVRDRNEDAVLAGPDVFAVADGMGGHAGGEVASALAIAELADLDGLLRHPEPGRAVRGALERANAAIRRRAEVDLRLDGMGTTVAGMARVAGRRAVIFHLGDSRVYRLRQGRLQQLTEDHSVVAELLRAAEITEDEARHHPHRNVVTRALGVADAIDPVISTIEVEVGDRFLITSDGLVHEVDVDRLAAIVRGGGSVHHQARLLVDEAVRNGGRDNVSVVVVATSGTSGADGLDADTAPSVRISTDGREVDPARPGSTLRIP